MSKYKALSNILKTGLDVGKKTIDNSVDAAKAIRLTKSSKSAGLASGKIATKSSPAVKETTQVAAKKSPTIRQAAKKSAVVLTKGATYGAIGFGGLGLLDYGNEVVTKFTDNNLKKREIGLDQDAQDIQNQTDLFNLNKDKLDEYVGAGGNPLDYADAFAPDAKVDDEEETNMLTSPLALVVGGLVAFGGYKYFKKSKSKAK